MYKKLFVDQSMHCNVSWAVFTEVVTCGGLADLTTKETKRFDLFFRAPLLIPPHRRSCRPRQMGFGRFSIQAGHNAASRQLNGFRL